MIDLTLLTAEQIEGLALTQKQGLDREWSGHYNLIKADDKIVIHYQIVTKSPSGEVLDRMTENVVVSALSDVRFIRRDATTGAVVTQYVKPEGTELKFLRKGQLMPHDGTDFVDWQKEIVEHEDIHGDIIQVEQEYIANPAWDTAISEFDFFLALIDSDTLSIKDLIVNTFIELNAKGRFDV